MPIAMLNDSKGNLWSHGAAMYEEDQKLKGHKYPITIHCQLGSQGVFDWAFLDTGARWSMIGGDLVEILEKDLFSPGDSFKYITRMGDYYGTLYRLIIRLLADENCGTDINIDGTVFVSKEWPGPVVLGYRGFLERIRFAFDPGESPQNHYFYFAKND